MEKILRFMIIFLGSYLLLMLFFPPENKDDSIEKDDIEINFSQDSYTLGDLVTINIKNNLEKDLSLGKSTPPEKLQIEKYKNGEWVKLFISNDPSEELILKSNTSAKFSYPEENTDFFNKEGQYRVKIVEGKKEFFKPILVEEPGFFGTIWQTFFWKPIYNGLIASLEITGKNLGLSIIILTIFIKLLLFIPTQKSMKSQRKMQTLQPELEKIKLKNAGNQQKIALETMNLWKKHNVNPLASLLPILLQFPILIALFYVIQEGLSHENSYFLYSPFVDFDYSLIITNFFNILPLLATPISNLSIIWLPLSVAIVQFYAMKLSFAKMKSLGKRKEGLKPKGFMEEFQQEFQKMNGVFVYILPIMVFFFTLFLPSAVGLYWLVSTLFSIGQQYAVNNEVDKK
jgi:YidC/Oxa1 family membrane protein insertase